MTPIVTTPGKPTQSGSVTVTILQLTKAITFTNPMPDTNYSVFFSPVGTLNTALSASGKTTTGFTMNLAVGVAGTINWASVGN